MKGYGINGLNLELKEIKMNTFFNIIVIIILWEFSKEFVYWLFKKLNK